MDTHEIDGVTLRLAHPDELNVEWVGQPFVQQQLLAAWMTLSPQDLPLHPRILGPPGVGKTSLAYATARQLGREVYIVQATMDTRPEDLLVQPVLAEDGKIRYVASGLVTAMIRGGVCVLDEGNRMSEKSWASLAPLLDTRRYVESVVAGLKIHAHPEFRFCATMNEDASTFEIPEYIHSRLQPRLRLEFPDRAEELAILRSNLPGGDDAVLEYVATFLERAHAADERYSVRDGINIARYALRVLAAQASGGDLGLAAEEAARARSAKRSGLRAVRESPKGEGGLSGLLEAALKGVLSEAEAAARPAGAKAKAAPESGGAESQAEPEPSNVTKVLRRAGLSRTPPPLDDKQKAVHHATLRTLGEEALRYLPGGQGAP